MIDRAATTSSDITPGMEAHVQIDAPGIEAQKDAMTL